ERFAHGKQLSWLRDRANQENLSHEKMEVRLPQLRRSAYAILWRHFVFYRLRTIASTVGKRIFDQQTRESPQRHDRHLLS
ncbi:hypothetical protein, partial [Xanthomonas citri]|uniref:hypothetical protein n=1 Tax=Xanthomonas citri TaxID=346 RepID=UPI001A8DA6D7